MPKPRKLEVIPERTRTEKTKRATRRFFARGLYYLTTGIITFVLVDPIAQAYNFPLVYPLLEIVLTEAFVSIANSILWYFFILFSFWLIFEMFMWMIRRKYGLRKRKEKKERII